MAKASKKKSNEAIEKLDSDLEKLLEIEEPKTVGLESDIDFELDTDELEARIAEVSEDIMSNSNSPDEGTLPSERVAAAAEALETSSTETQALPLPANDEHNSEINNLLYSISNTPTSYVFTLATLFTLVWLAACAFVGYQTVYDTLPSTFDVEAIINNQPLMIFGAFVLISLIFIWSCAILVKRSHDMKYSTNLMLSAAKQLLQPESIAIDSVTSVGTAVRREVAAIGEGVERAIARAGELEYMIQNEVMNIERSYGDSETRLRRLVEEISSEREEIVLHADKLQEAINKTHVNLASELETTAVKIDEVVRKSTDAQTKEMSESVVSAGQVVAKLLETRTASFQKASSAIEERLAAGNQALEQSIDSKTSDLSSIIASAGQSVSSIMNAGSANLAEKSNDLMSAIDVVQQKMIDEFVRQGETTTKNLEDSLSIRALEFGERITDSGDTIQTSLTNKLAQIDSSMTTVGEKLVSSLGMRAEEIDKLLAERNTELDQTLDTRLSSINETLVGHVDTSISRLQSSTDTMLENTKQAEEIITLRSKSVEDALKKSTIEFASSVGKNIETIQSGTSELGELVSTHSAGLEKQYAENKEELKNILESGASKIGSELSASSTHLNQSLENAASELNETLNISTSYLGDTLSKATSDIHSKLITSTSQLNSTLDKAASNIDSKLNASTSQMNDALEQATSNIDSNLSASTSQINDALEQATSYIDSNLNASTSQIKDTLDKATNEIGSKLSVSTSQLHETLENATENLDNKLNNSISAVEKQFVAGGQILETNLEKGQSNLLGTISKAVADSSKFIDESTDGLSSIFANSISEMASKLDYKTAQFNKLLSERAIELNNIIEEKASPIAGDLESVSAVISERLTSISDAVGANTTTLFNNLGDTKETLERLTEDTAFNLTSIRSKLIDHSEQFANLIKQSQEAMSTSTALSENIQSRLQASSANLLEGMQEIAGRVEVQGNNLQEATRLIDATQTNFENTVDHKQVVLNELSSAVTQRSEQLNDTINSFGGVINQLVAQVSETSQSLSGTVSSDISSTIDEATARFNATVNEMKNTAQEMRTELEQTREEMRRGVLELPEETSQSANAMRKVVTDQISALKDLTRIIEDSGQMLDTKPSVDQPVPQPVAAVQAPAPAPAPKTPLPKASTPPLRPSVAPARSTTPLPSAKAVPAAKNTNSLRVPLRKVQPTQQAPTPTIEPVKSDGDGWVSDLLRRASQEPEQKVQTRTPLGRQSSAPSLKNLSADIPNAIDNHIISDLWTRYRDGEDNLFSRDMYNLSGQLLFDQIAQHYARNAELKTGIDNYINDFEGRLEQANNQGTSDEAIHNYLISDQGKIYTMFAHAAGRYDA